MRQTTRVGTSSSDRCLVLWSPDVGRATAHHLIRSIALPDFGIAGDGVRVVNHCRACGSTEHGRLALTGVPGDVTVHVSASYCADVTVVAVTLVGPVGVDVERADAMTSFVGFNEVVSHAAEKPGDYRSKAATWVRKESLLKATGLGMSVDPRRVQVTESDQSPRLVAWEADEPPGSPVWMDDVALSPDHVAAVTVLAAERPHLVVRRAAEAAAAASARPATR